MEESEIQPQKETVDEPEKETVDKPEQTTILMGVSQSTRGYPNASKSSLHALEWVLQKLIHKNCRQDYKLKIVHVKVPDEDGMDDVDSIYATRADFDAAKRKGTQKSLQLLEVFLNKCKEIEVPVEGWVKIGNPKDVICAEVLRVKPDMLVLGSRGLGQMQRIFVGGVSSFCAKKVQCPVLIIKRNLEDIPDDASED